MRCPRCELENPEPSTSCSSCGARLELLCPDCSAVVAEQQRYCGACGASLAGDAEAAASRDRGAEPSASSPSGQLLVELIRHSRSVGAGERRPVTILFAALAESVPRLSELDPEPASALLTPAVQAMMDAVRQHGGTVGQVTGDGIMALFGVPEPLEDHAVAGCRAAQTMRETVPQTTAGQLRLRIGLHSGEVTVQVPAPGKPPTHYDAVGAAVHLASRMEQLAGAGEILITGSTRRLAGDRFAACEARGPLLVKGVLEPVEVFALEIRSAAVSGSPGRSGPRPTPLAGRQSELATLGVALAGAGAAGVVSLAGEAGSGKSRLIQELVRSRLPPGWTVLETSCSPEDRDLAYSTLGRLLVAWLRGRAGQEHGLARRLSERLEALDPALLPSLPAFLALLGRSSDDEAWRSLAPWQRRQCLHRAAREWASRVAAEQPLLLVVDDAHWSDSQSLELFAGLVDALPHVSLRLLVAYDSAHRLPWEGDDDTLLRIGPLEPGASAELVRALLGEDPRLEPVHRRLIERAKGWPLQFEEMVRTLVEDGILEGERGAYRLERPTAELTMPADLRSLLAERIQRLPPKHRELLEAAAVIGNGGTLRLLRCSILDEAGDATEEVEIASRLAALQAAELVQVASEGSTTTYMLRHPLTLEAAYAGLPKSRRRDLHSRCLAAIESAEGIDLHEPLDRLAHHAFAGECWPKAATYLVREAERGLDLDARREATRHFERALIAVARLPENRSTQEQLVDLRLRLATIMVEAGDLGRLRHHLDKAEEIAEGLADRRRRFELELHRCHLLALEGDLDEGVRTAAHTLDRTELLDDPTAAAEARLYLAQALALQGRSSRAVELLEQDTELWSREVDREQVGQVGSCRVTSQATLADAHAQRGELAVAEVHARAAARTAEASRRPADHPLALGALGYVALRRGELDRAADWLEAGVAHSEEAQLPLLSCWLRARLGLALTLAGRTDDAAETLEHASAEAVRLGLPVVEAHSLLALGELALASNQPDEAEASARRAAGIARTGELPLVEAQAECLRGRVFSHLQRLDPDSARQHLGESLDLAGRLGARPDVAHAHLALAELFARIDSAAQAREQARTALDLYRAMGMVHWDVRAEELGSETVEMPVTDEHE